MTLPILIAVWIVSAGVSLWLMRHATDITLGLLIKAIVLGPIALILVPWVLIWDRREIVIWRRKETK